MSESENTVQATEVVFSVPEVAIRSAIDSYKGQFDGVQQSLRTLDAEYEQRKTTGINLLNQLQGAITALTVLIQPQEEPKSE